MQNAYAQYLAYHRQFIELTTPWAEGCRASVATGEILKTMGTADFSNFGAKLSEMENALNSVNDPLKALLQQG
ncbi:MAG: hypothetical protein KC423_01985 [Anaerolineales bacterium]|nr:hypothetical protein [Anaerolineales bacterium]